MRTLTSYISRFLLILIFFSAVSVANAAAKPGGRLIVIRVANFGWNLAANLKILHAAKRAFNKHRPSAVLYVDRMDAGRRDGADR